MGREKETAKTERERALLGEEHRERRDYFVDEAGDPILFNARKQIVVGTDGSSRYFILGALDVPDPVSLERDLLDLRKQLLAAPYFQGVPSFDPARRKTAIAFHAKDDVSEVRREVLRLLLRHEMKFYAVVRDKHEVVGEVRRRNARDPNHRYRPNELYDKLVERLFKDRLHKGKEFHVWFAQRGSSDRTDALRRALESARARFHRQWGKESEAPIHVEATVPSRCTCLQAIDYFLWALQRRYERMEGRYMDMLWDKVGLIIDADSKEAGDGSYYTRERKLPSAVRIEEASTDGSPSQGHKVADEPMEPPPVREAEAE